MSKLFPYGVKAPAEIPDVADRILDEFFLITKNLGMRACLAYGLCLGFKKSNGYMVGDNDLDVIVVTPPYPTVICKLGSILVTNGYKVEMHYLPPVNNLHFIKDDILLDIFFRQNHSYYEKFDALPYKGKQYPVPSPVEDYLKACYGDWEIDKEDGQGRGDI